MEALTDFELAIIQMDV